MTERVGFVGLGTMGQPMALRLIDAGYPMSIYARRPEAMQTLVAAGACACDSPRAVASRSDIVFTMVTAAADVEEVVLGEHGLIHALAAGAMVVDMSTISPLATRRIAERLAARGVEMVDAPVSGGPTAAQAGTLAIMVGASETAFRCARPLLERLGRTLLRMGESGAGQIAKACTQLALCVTIEGIAEALVLAARMGADPAAVRQAMLGGYAASRALEVFGERMVARDFVAGVQSRLHHKDLGMVLELAHGLGLAVPAAAVTAQSFNALVGAGGGRDDSAALLRIVEGAIKG